MDKSEKELQPDWSSLMGKIVEEYDVMEAKGDERSRLWLKDRMTQEIRNAWLAGQGYERVPSPDPCISEVEKVEVHTQTCIRTSDGMVVSRVLQKITLDLKQYSCDQRQQYAHRYGKDGVVVDFIKIGKPHLVLQGVVDNIQNIPINESSSSKLDILVDKVEDVFIFKAYWKDRNVMKFELHDQELSEGNLCHHADLMIDHIGREVGYANVSRCKIIDGLMTALADRIGTVKSEMSEQDQSSTEESVQPKSDITDLDISMNRVGGMVKLEALWKGERVAGYELGEQVLLTENVDYHIGPFINRIFVGIKDGEISSEQIKSRLLEAVEVWRKAAPETEIIV